MIGNGPYTYAPEPMSLGRRIVWGVLALIGLFVALVVIAFVVNSLAVNPAAAAEPVAVAVVEPTWWQTVLSAMTPALVALGVVVLGWIGMVVKALGDKYLPAFISRIVSDQYDKMADAGAGFLENELKKLAAGGQTPLQAVLAPGASAPPLTPDHPAVKAAVDYVHESFREALGKAGVFGAKSEVAADIIGAFGKLVLAGKAKPAGG